MRPELQAAETKARELAAEMTKDEGLAMLEVMLERTNVDQIFDAVVKAKLSDEVTQLTARLNQYH